MSNVTVGRAPALRRPADASPPLPVVAAISTALFVAGLVVPVFLADGQRYPSPFEAPEALVSYVGSHADAVRFAALFQFAASIPLAVFTASVVARLHALGVRAAGPTIALVGGVLAAAAMAVSACAQWVLSHMSATTSRDLLSAVHELVFISGGPWHVVAFGLLLAGIAVPAAFHRLLPRPMWMAGVALAVLCEFSTVAFAVPAAAYLLPLGRFGGLIWLITAAALLPRTRHRHDEAAASSTSRRRSQEEGSLR